MSAIRCIYHGKEPNFPATDQHPDAVRYKVGLYFVDAIGGEPTQAELDAVLNPPPPPKRIADGDLAAVLVTKGLITQAEVDAAVAAVAVPKGV